MDAMQEQDEMAEFGLTEDEIDAMMERGEPVEITGPPRRVRFELITGGLHSYRWRLVGGDGEIVAMSEASYRSPEDVRRALSVLSVAMRDAPVVDASGRDDEAHPIAS